MRNGCSSTLSAHAQGRTLSRAAGPRGLRTLRTHWQRRLPPAPPPRLAGAAAPPSGGDYSRPCSRSAAPAPRVLPMAATPAFLPVRGKPAPGLGVLLPACPWPAVRPAGPWTSSLPPGAPAASPSGSPARGLGGPCTDKQAAVLPVGHGVPGNAQGGQDWRAPGGAGPQPPEAVAGEDAPRQPSGPFCCSPGGSSVSAEGSHPISRFHCQNNPSHQTGLRSHPDIR